MHNCVFVWGKNQVNGSPFLMWSSRLQGDKCQQGKTECCEQPDG